MQERVENNHQQQNLESSRSLWTTESTAPLLLHSLKAPENNIPGASSSSIRAGSGSLAHPADGLMPSNKEDE